ncbi:MAG: hypothetical protein COT22_02730 [Ignavibacteria bacterium CG08_land_8_20_14_0_20_37_9]|nr:MAG: hypothetical protein COT22_02730 [Ignavibacteria bacterium CG08_land_8_20_14_0_20_37_9]PIX93746.1 MAG: hypothetical protein COZ25_09045 [Ignavibacteria bacterium CG_4_10_14_3_um_filter_37_18]
MKSNRSMQSIYFKSKLSLKYKSELERIFYFNINQKNHLKKIDEAVEVFGIPRLILNGNYVSFTFDKVNSFQVLYALDDEDEDAHLLGVIIFYSDLPTNIKIMHIAVDENCSSRGEFKEETIAARLIDEVRKISLALKSIKTFTLPYTSFKISLRTNFSFY